MSLTACLKKAGDSLNREDKARVLELARQYRQEGLSPDEAAIKAVDEQLAAVQARLEEAQDVLTAPTQEDIDSERDADRKSDEQNNRDLEESKRLIRKARDALKDASDRKASAEKNSLEYGQAVLDEKKAWVEIARAAVLGWPFTNGPEFQQRVDNLNAAIKSAKETEDVIRANFPEVLAAPTRADVLAQQDRAATADTRDQREQVRKESEAGAGLFELTQEDGRQDTTGSLFDQPDEPPAPAQEKPVSQMSAADLLRAAADRMDGKPEKIDDLGEKIGGARKDTAVSTGRAPRKSAESDDRPTWAKRFQISQIVRAGGQIGEVRNEGRWVIRDTRSLDWMKQPKQVGRETFASREAAEKALPLLAVAQKHRVVPVSVAGGTQAWEIWRDISDRKRVKVVDLQFTSRDDAMRYMAEHATEIIEANTTFGEADLPVPENKQRVGKLRRGSLLDAVVDAADADAKRLADRVITQSGFAKPDGLGYIPLETVNDARLTSDMRAALDKSSAYMAAANTKLLGYLNDAGAFSVEGYGRLDIPSRRIVQTAMISLGQDAQILRSVVELVPVDVVNLLSGQQLSAKTLLRDKTMLGDLLAVDLNPSVGTPDAAALALVRSVATAGAKDRLSKTVNSALENDSALRASGFDFSHQGSVERDISGEDFMSEFGFRSIEFGNWNNQDERQQLMNEAYDGLMDLAEVMGIPPKAISLNGDLALAFGARGHGLSGARAHYEPDRAVMNLTKMKGAGALAHEWFHALDHYFGRQDGKAPVGWVTNKDGTRSLKVSGDFESNAVSSGFSRANSGVRPEVREAYTAVMETMMRKAEKYVQDTARVEQFVATVRDGVEKRLADIRRDLAEQKDVRYYKRNNKPASAEQLAEFDDVARQIIEGTALETELRPSATKTLTGMRWSNDHLEKLSTIYKAVRGRSGFDAEQNGTLDRLRQEMGLYSARLKMLAEAQNGEEKTKKVPTDFAMDAKSLDQGRGTDYWITPHEMAARAFQGYVEDKIGERGGKSPFLNYAPENAGILTPWGAKRPYPAGAERKAINSAFDKLVDVIETKETDQGVAMYARGSFDAAAFRRAFGAPEPMSLDRTQKIVDEMTASWENGPVFKVVATAKDLPGGKQPGDARGLLQNGTAYIVAANNPTRDAIARTLGHEAIGHYGLWKALGVEGTRKFRANVQLAIKTGNKPLNAIRDKVRSLYVDERGKFNLSPEQEADEIAAFAVEEAIDPVTGEFRPGFGFFKSVWAKIAEFLRDTLGLPVSFTNVELQGLLVQSMRGLQTGKRLDGEAEVMVAAARDESPEGKALQALSENDELFALPKSSKITVAEIAADNNPNIKVRQTKIGNETLYTLTMPNGDDAKLWVRPANPYGDHIYSMDLVDGDTSNVETGRPGENPEDVDPTIEDVYLDVSNLKEGGHGNRLYNIAATFAHNTGRIFIGDPSGLTDTAMRRRLENMISTALKFGTTDHIAPHPRQVKGDAKLGIPPLKWVYGDSLGNIRRMIDVSLKAEETSDLPKYVYDPATGNLAAAQTGGRPLAEKPGPARGGVSDVLGAPAQRGRTGARAAIFRALLREEGGGAQSDARGRDGLLARLVSVGNQFPGAAKGIFYARGPANANAGQQPGANRPAGQAANSAAAGQPAVTPPAGTPTAASADQTDTPAFRKWFGDSKVVRSEERRVGKECR